MISMLTIIMDMVPGVIGDYLLDVSFSGSPYLIIL
jgi:hypothetical protein